MQRFHANLVVFTILTICFIETCVSGDNKASTTKIPLPEPPPGQTHVEVKYCQNTNETDTVTGNCTHNAVQGGTKSPCPKHCFAAHIVQPGDVCDPMLYRFARRQYDDASELNKDWMGAKPGTRGIIGKPFQDVDADYQYKGQCRFLCPKVMCMGVYLDDTGEQYVDLVLWDCVSNHLLDKYQGVCACGYLWSFVDPRNPCKKLDPSTLLVSYQLTIGLNRRLAWDKARKKCAAQRYGHCSLDWPNSIPDEQKTTCLEPEKYQCVNRTANFLGVSYRPLQLKNTSSRSINCGPLEEFLWYGICDSEVLIEDPFGRAARELSTSKVLLLASTLALLYVHYTPLLNSINNNVERINK